METETAPTVAAAPPTTTLVVDPLEINKYPKIIREAQQEIGKLDILVCGNCHNVFHYMEQLQEHRLPGNCSGQSAIRENNINESKSQVWAFLLWKGAQKIEENENSWHVYQRWCKLDSEFKETWIAAGSRVQAFTKLSAAKMQEVRNKTQIKSKVDDDPLEEGEIKDPLADSEEPSDSEMDSEEEAEKEEIKNAAKNNGSTSDKENGIKKPQGVPVATEKTSRIAKRTDKVANTTKECIVERILAKRFNPRKKTYEYLIKWEGFTHEQNTWEPPVHLSASQHLIEAFERNLARQKEAKAAAQAALLRQQQKQAEKAAQQLAGPSGVELATTPGGRPQRTSKQKALNQVKQWCGNISDRDDELGLKRRGDSDSDEDTIEKKMKLEYDSGSEDEWQADESEIDRHTSIGRPKIVQKTHTVLNGIAKKQMTANEIARSIGLASPDHPNSPPVLQNAKGVVKIFKNQMPNLASGVYIMSKKDGIVKLESSSNIIAGANTNIVRVQKTVGGQSTASIIRVAPKLVGQTSQVRVVQKTTNVAATALNESVGNVVRLSPGMSRPIASKLNSKPPIKPIVRVTSAGQKEPLQAQRMQIGTPQLKVVRKGPLNRPLGKTMSLIDLPDPDAKSDTSEDDFDPFPKDLPPPEPDSPPREFTLDPLTGLILGQAEGEPEPQIEEPQQPEQQEQVEDIEEKKYIPVEGAIDADQKQTQDMPSLIMTDQGLMATTDVNIENSLNSETTTLTLPENGEPLMITGEDGVVYQVAGQNEEGQTLLVAQGVDGQMYVTAATTTTSEDNQSSVLTLDSAVAEAIDSEHAVVSAGEGVMNEMEPLTVNTATMEEQGELGDDGSSQVVAQLVKAELPSPGGTRKVVLLLPDGNLLMTEVDAEQYAALELDK